MNDDELELKLLQECVAKYDRAMAESPDDKCAREIDVRGLLGSLTGHSGRELDVLADRWLVQLTSSKRSLNKGLLKRCTDSRVNTTTHKYRARAFQDLGNVPPAPAWERISELQKALHGSFPSKELDQKFGILLSPAQAERDFTEWCNGGAEEVSALYIDIDGFKQINTRHLESVVDQTILPKIQELIRTFSDSRGSAYREGGDEFIILLRNQDTGAVHEFAEKLRSKMETTPFIINGESVAIRISIGMSSYPSDANNYQALKEAANSAKREAKNAGGNLVTAFKSSGNK